MNTLTDPYTAPDFGSLALVTIDVQRDFLDAGPGGIPGTRAILPQLATLVAAFRKAAQPIVHVVRIYRPDGSNVDLCRRSLIKAGREIVCPGTSGLELAPELFSGATRLDPELLLDGQLEKLGPQEWAMYKPRWGAFYQTGLEQHLRTHQVSTIAFAGCNYPNCPRASVYEASERDFRIVLVADAVSGLYDQGRAEMERIGVTVLSTAALLEAVGTHARVS